VNVRLAEPLPVAGPLVLDTTTLMFLATPWMDLVYVGPSTPASLAGPVLIVDGAPWLLYVGEMVDAAGWGLNPLAGINAQCYGDPVEPTTWGSVKALYR
jgi:hypothetical protein